MPRLVLVTALLLTFFTAFSQSPIAPTDTFLTGTTLSRLTPLYYGPGTDRLGGARLETLDSGVALNITGHLTREGSSPLWRVRLAPGRTAYVPVEQTVVDTLSDYPVGSLTGSWRVWGDDRFDYVSIPLPARLPYASQQQTDPSRVVVDLFGLTSNTNWITHLSSLREIRKAWYEQVSDEVFRVYIDLKHRQHWGHSVYYENNRLTIRVRRQPERLRLRGLTVAVDAGHGGTNLGAQGLNAKRFEKEFTLDVARRLAQELEKAGARVILTRATDTLIGPSARILALRQSLPHLLVSIHFNASGNRETRGVSTYYKHAGFQPLTRAVLHELLRIDPHEAGNVGSFNFFFSAPTDYPNVLVEGPFLSNPDDEALILDERYRRKMARAIRKGIKKFLKQAGRVR